MAEQEQDRSEAATPFKLRQARRKGSVAKSMEVHHVVVIAAFLLCLHAWVGTAGVAQARLFRNLLMQAGRLGFEVPQVMGWLMLSLTDTLALWVPVLGAVMLAGTLAGVAQHGVVFSTHPLKPDINRLNPVTGFKRLFSRRALFDLLKNLGKLALYAAVLVVTVWQTLPALTDLLWTDRRMQAAVLGQQVSTLVFRMLLAMSAVALLDLLYSRREYADKLRMSRRELKEEARQREGDPKIKARIRELRHELRRKSAAMRNLPHADVLITNPTHLAVALTYRHQEMSAPTVVAKGANDLVEKMKTVARRHGVAIVENRRLAQALYPLDLHATVPEMHYAAVARILVWVQAARQRRHTGLKGPG